jgi:hypothetical protein
MNYYKLYSKYKNKYMIEKNNNIKYGGSGKQTDDFNSLFTYLGDDFTFYVLPTLTLDKLLKKAIQSNHMDLLYMINKIVCLTDSIGEGWNYECKVSRKEFNDKISKLPDNFYTGDSPAMDGTTNYISLIILPIYRLLLLEFKDFKIRKIDKFDLNIEIKNLKTIFNESEKKGYSELLFKINKIVAENDSISEGWKYTPEYTKNKFNKEIKMLHKNKINGSYLGMVGLVIFKLVMDSVII